MKKIIITLFMVMILCGGIFAEGSSEAIDTKTVQTQQNIYNKVLPVPLYDYSIPRDVLIQIYDVVTTKAYTTYTIITSMTGETFYEGNSIGYALPVDTSLTNPLKSDYYSSGSVTLEQAEPNGLYSSKNTDGTWVLFLQEDGTIAPVYTELKVSTFPYSVVKTTKGYVRKGNEKIQFTIDVKN